jgi:hypothetical protein
MIFWPVRILRYVFYLPCLLVYYWYIYDECFINKLHQKDIYDNVLIQDLFEIIDIKMTKLDSERLNYCGIITITLTCIFRVMMAYGVFRK